MAKFGLIGVSLAALLVFGSCSNNIEQASSVVSKQKTDNIKPQKSYGAYIAGRVAHLRKDFNNASNYYIKALENDPNNPELVSRLYLLLASEGRIDEAAEYASISLKNGDKNNFIYIIVAVDNMKQKNYAETSKSLKNLKGPIYDDFINPLLNSWAYVGQNQPDKALAELKVLSKEPSFKALYNFHAGMINDYFGRNEQAQKHYEVIVKEESAEMSFRALQVISNFYIRTNQKDKAIILAGRYNDDKMLVDMLNNLNKNIKKANLESTKTLIVSPDVGTAEALFSIAATLRQGEAGIDLAHMFISMAIYENPKYDLARLLLADILENREMYADANEVYEAIPQSSEAYYTAQLKRANNYVMMEDYASAELLLKTLALDNPSNYQLFLDLGDILRVKNKPQEAIKYYEQAIKKLPKVDNQHWVLFYALGISYEQNNQWGKAEETFKKALELGQNHYLVLNYLGYSWIRQGKNIDQAFTMIVDAYNQAPQDGNISDSLGWALYQLGYYDKAITYLEKAAEIEPANAVISDHLGDAYWFGKRKNEAIFQWRHALTMKDDSGELKPEDVKKKISDGLKALPSLQFDSAIIEEQIGLITTDTAPVASAE